MSSESNNFIPKPPPSTKDSTNHIKTINISKTPRRSILLYLDNNLIVRELNLKGVLIVNNFNIKANFLRIQTNNINHNLTLFKYNTIDEVNSILKSISEGINNLHSINIPHLNLKPSNILISSSSNEVFISDYNINSIRNSNEIPFSSVQYFSPEQLLDREITYKSDIWSFGCIIYYVITKKQLLEGTEIEELKSKLLHIKLESNDDNSLLSKDKYLLKLMLRIKPQNRVSIKEVYEELKSLNTIVSDEYNNQLLLDRNNCILYISNKYNYELCEDEYNIINSNSIIINRLIKECNTNGYNNDNGNGNGSSLMCIYVLINSILHSKDWDNLKCCCYDVLNDVYYKELSMSIYRQMGICFRCSYYLDRKYIFDFVNNLHLLRCITYLDLERNGIDEEEELMLIFYDKLSYLTSLKRLKLENFLSFKFPSSLKYIDLFIYSIEPNEYRLNLSNQGLDIKEKEYLCNILNESEKLVVIIDRKG